MLTSGSDKIEILCHWVLSCFSPEFLSLQDSEVATEKLQTRPPLGKFLISGSFPKFPIIITLFTLPAIYSSI